MPSSPIDGSDGFLRNWLPVFLWASVIFVFFTDTFSSANTGAAIEPLLHQLFPQFAADDIELIHLAFRKGLRYQR